MNYTNWEHLKETCRSKRWLVTGGAGFIGSHITEMLCDFGAEVIVADNFSTGSMENLASVKKDNLKILEGDICDPSFCEQAVRGIDYVIHQAAIASVSKSLQHPDQTFATNVQGFINILTKARECNAKKVVYASSSAVYGNTDQIPVSEKMPLQPLSPYGLSKKFNEDVAESFHNVFNLKVVGLRYFNVFGPRQAADSPYSAVIPRWVQSLKTQGSAEIFGNGLQTRDFIYVKNIVLANILAATSEQPISGKVFNIGSGIETSLLSLFQEISDLLGEPTSPKFLSPRNFEIRRSVADMKQARDLLSFSPFVGLKEGLKETIGRN